MKYLLNPIWEGLLFITLIAACGATNVEDVDPAVVGKWELLVPGPGGNTHWVWDIHPNGTYEFQIEGFGAQNGHSGTFTAVDGKWTLTATTMKYEDGGTYQTPDQNTFTATGRLGTASWRRKEPVTVTKKNVLPVKKPEDAPSTNPTGQLSGANPYSELSNNLKKIPTVTQGVNAYLLGLDALEAGRWKDAVQQLNSALQHEPDNPDYFIARGVAYAFSQQLKESEKDLRRATRFRPQHKPTKMWLATVVGMQGRFSEDQSIYPFATLDQYENAVRKMSHEYGDMFFRKTMGDDLGIQQARPAHDNAIRVFPTLAKMFVDRTKPAGSSASGGQKGGLTIALRQRGIDRYQAGQCTQAFHDLSHAYQANPDDKEVLFYLAECKRQLGSPEGARADYTVLLVEEPNHARAIAGRALAHAALGDMRAAQQGMAEALKIDPKLDAQYANQLKQLANNFTPATDNQRGPALLEQLRKSAQEGASWNTLLQLAKQVFQASQYGRLRADEQYQITLSELRRAVGRANATADDFAALGQFLYEQSLIVVGEAVEPHAPNRPYRPQSKNAQERELTQAEAAVDRALTMNPNHPRALAFKGACRFKRDNDWVTAEKFLSRAIDLDDKDSVIQDLFAIVLDYIAFVQASAASELRSVDTWEDTHYIYYRYPSEAELRRANELDAIARRLWAKAQKALEQAIAAAPNSAQSYYYQSILSERNKNLLQAAQQLKKAIELDPTYFEAAQRLSTIAHKIGQTQLAYTAQSIATNLVQTSAAPMLKLSWIEFSRTAYQSATKALTIAANLDSSDSRAAAYQGAVARENGNHVLAESWFMAAVALEEVRLALLGINVRETREIQYRPHDISRLLAINNAAATELNERNRFQQTAALLEINSAIYRQISQESKYAKSPYGLLPELFEDPSRIPEAPTIEALVVWSTIHAAKANVGLKRYDTAMKQYEWAADFEARKPPTMDQGMAVRIPGMWARLGMADIELRKGNGQAASQRMQFYGHPSIATPAMKAEADRLRNAIEDLGFRSGGQTLHDLRDQQRRKFQRNQR